MAQSPIQSRKLEEQCESEGWRRGRGRGWKKIKKEEKRKIGNSGGVQKIEGLGTLCQLQQKEPQQ